MRLGGPIQEKCPDPAAWTAAVKRLGYRAAYCPLGADAADDLVKAYEAAAKAADIVIAEVGAWSNPIDPDAAKAKAAIEKNTKCLALADRIGAWCCVNIAGSRNPASWHGPAAENLTKETFDLIVQTVRGIIDAVRPARTFYTLECMQWTPPNTADSYVDLLKAVDRPRFAAHFDPVNMIWSPERYFRTGEIIREFVAKLGPRIRSCHAKDILLEDKLTVHLGEAIPGTGNLDYKTFLLELARLDPDLPLMLEHLKTAEEYAQAAKHIRGVAGQVGVTL
ncbi:MAG: sugar phosphate isomerase/epimerase [Planctomycetes bacterium]|nr:sugar phosphate isomerase/epimerase [Planctomycetota bacterium]